MLLILLSPLAVLMILPPVSSYVDCRTACRSCHEGIEPPSVVEVYCSMCEECRARRKDKLAMRSRSTTHGLHNLKGVVNTESINVETKEPEVPPGCPTSPPCPDSEETIIPNEKQECPPLKVCKMKLSGSLPSVELPSLKKSPPPPYYPHLLPPYPSPPNYPSPPHYPPPPYPPYPPPCYGGCMPPMPMMLPQFVPQTQTTTTSTTTTTEAPTTETDPITTTIMPLTSTEKGSQVFPLPPWPVYYPPPPQPCIPPCLPCAPSFPLPYPPYNPHYPGYPGVSGNVTTTVAPTLKATEQPGTPGTSEDYIQMYVGVPMDMIDR